MTPDAREMARAVNAARHDLVCLERFLDQGHMTPLQALAAAQTITSDLNEQMTKIIVRIHSQPIIPGMEKSVVQV